MARSALVPRCCRGRARHIRCEQVDGRDVLAVPDTRPRPPRAPAPARARLRHPGTARARRAALFATSRALPFSASIVA